MTASAHDIFTHFLAAMLLSGIPLSALAASTPAEDRQTVSPAVSDAFLRNPGMGWVVFGDATSFTDARVLALTAVGYTRFEWHQLQPTADRFDWQPLDAFIAGWAARGKQAAFGIMAANTHSAAPHVTPQWVFDAGAASRSIAVEAHVHARAGTKVVPVFNDPMFLAQLERFLHALAERYDGDPRVAFIDIRSYGNWGEGHVGFLGGGAITDDEFLTHVRLHRQAFARTRLILPLTDDLEHYRPVAEWAVAHGIGVRRDGIVGNSDGSETAIAHSRTPAVFEWYQTYEYLVEQGWWNGRSARRGYGYPLADCIERGHPSYVQLGYWGGANVAHVVAAEGPLIERLSRRIGYRLAITAAELPRQAQVGEPWELAVTIANHGVADVLVPCHAAVALLDQQGAVVARVEVVGAEPSAWRSDATVAQTWRIAGEQLPAGRFTVAVGLFTALTAANPDITFANVGVAPNGWMPLGALVIAP